MPKALTFRLAVPTLAHLASTHSLSFEQVAAGPPSRPCHRSRAPRAARPPGTWHPTGPDSACRDQRAHSTRANRACPERDLRTLRVRTEYRSSERSRAEVSHIASASAGGRTFATHEPCVAGRLTSPLERDIPAEGASPTSRRKRASRPSAIHARGHQSGFRHTPMGIFRQPIVTPAAESHIAITRIGTPCEASTSSGGCSHSVLHCRGSHSCI